jgi:uncharacterized protein (DUF697 family)
VDGAPFLLCAKRDEDLGMHREFGINELIQASFRVMPKEAQPAFASAQKYDLETKDNAADVAIGIATTAAAAIGASPIPFSDALLLAPTQLALIMRIAQIYNISMERATAVALTATAAATSVGKSFVGNLIKLIPGIGTGVGGLITGTVASAMTFGIGRAWKEVCKKIWTGEIDEEMLKNIDFITSLFMGFFKTASSEQLKRNGK